MRHQVSEPPVIQAIAGLRQDQLNSCRANTTLNAAKQQMDNRWKLAALGLEKAG